MKNKYDNIYIFASFIPLILLPISVVFSLLFTFLITIYGIHFQSETVFKKSLVPLTLSFVFGVGIGIIQFFILLFALLGKIFTGVGMLNFVFGITKVFSFINFALLLFLIVCIVFAIMAVKHNKKMPFFQKIINFFEKANTDNQQEEIVIDPED